MITHADIAIGYASAYNWAVHPVNLEKKPTSKHGRNDATRDEKAIRAFFRNGAQIGVATGSESGLFVLDVDLDEQRGINGYETLAYLETIHGPLPATPCQRTGRGGMQYLFRHQDGLKNSTGKIGAGIDTRGQGGYIVVAPSRNTNGPYTWVIGPDAQTIADVPPWIVKALTETDTPQAQAQGPGSTDRDYCLKMLGQAVARVATASDGQKHDTLLKMARWMGGFVPIISETEIESALFAAVELRADDSNGARKTIQDGIAHGKAAPLDVPPSPRQNVDRKTGEIKASPEGKPAPDYIMAEPSEMPESGLIMERLKLLGFTFRLNLCTDAIEVNGRKMSDIMVREIRTALRDIGMTKKLAAAEDAYTAYAKKDAYHPIHDYLNSLKWDGEDHIGKLLSYMDSADQPITYRDGTIVPLHAVYIYRWLIGAVAKTLDAAQLAMLVLDGDQDLGKSTFTNWLCSALPEYFIESAINVADKDTDIRLIDRWIWEVAELDATTRKADQSALKSFITKKFVTVRKPFGHHDIVKPALACMIGTLNNSTGFLTDDTGNRRFLITRLTRIDFHYMNIDVNQVWAQATALYRDREPFKLVGEEQRAQAATNKSYEVESLVTDYLDKYYTFDPDFGDEQYTLGEIALTLRDHNIPLHGSERAQYMELARILALKGAYKVHTVNGNRWTGFYKRAI